MSEASDEIEIEPKRTHHLAQGCHFAFLQELAA
jgi:hypothetical protein